MDARANERILIVPEKSWVEKDRKWKLDTPLGKDVYLLTCTDPETGKVMLLPELLRKQPSEGWGVHRRVVLKGPGVRLYHLVWGEDMPVHRIEYSYDDLTGEMEDTIMFGRERPDLLVYFPIYGWRGGIWKGEFNFLPDPVREIRKYNRTVKIHEL